MEMRPHGAPVRRGQGGRPLRSVEALPPRAGAHDAPLRLGDPPVHRSRPRHPGAGHGDQRTGHGLDHGYLQHATGDHRAGGGDQQAGAPGRLPGPRGEHRARRGLRHRRGDGAPRPAARRGAGGGSGLRKRGVGGRPDARRDGLSHGGGERCPRRDLQSRGAGRFGAPGGGAGGAGGPPVPGRRADLQRGTAPAPLRDPDPGGPGGTTDGQERRRRSDPPDRGRRQRPHDGGSG